VPEDRDLRLVDDRGVEERPRLPVLVSVNVPPTARRGDLVGAGALGDVGDLAGQAGDRQVAGLLDDRASAGLSRCRPAIARFSRS
jgi:hypothetical protein